MNYFFENLEDSSAFSFYFDNNGKAIQVKETHYILYEGDAFPMTVFADELRALNDYCYTTVTSAQEELTNIEKKLEYYLKKEQESSWTYKEFTPYETQLALEMEQSQWKWIEDVTAGHLVILLYSFLEKTLKYIHQWFADEHIIVPQYKIRNPKTHFLLYNIFEMEEAAFQEKYKDVYDILEKCRNIRNHFAHDNLEGVERADKDCIYEKRVLKESFRLIDIISVISIILYEIERIYDKTLN